MSQDKGGTRVKPKEDLLPRWKHVVALAPSCVEDRVGHWVTQPGSDDRDKLKPALALAYAAWRDLDRDTSEVR